MTVQKITLTFISEFIVSEATQRHRKIEDKPRKLTKVREKKTKTKHEQVTYRVNWGALGKAELVSQQEKSMVVMMKCVSHAGRSYGDTQACLYVFLFLHSRNCATVGFSRLIRNRNPNMI